MFMITKKDGRGTTRVAQLRWDGVKLLAPDCGLEDPTMFVRREDAEAAVRMIAKYGSAVPMPGDETGMEVVEGKSAWQDSPRVIAVIPMNDAHDTAPALGFVAIAEDGMVKQVRTEAEATVFGDLAGAVTAMRYMATRVKVAGRDEWLRVRRLQNPNACGAGGASRTDPAAVGTDAQI